MCPKLDKNKAENIALKNIENILLLNGMRLNDFEIPNYDESLIQEETDEISHDYTDNEFIGNNDNDDTIDAIINTLTIDQRRIFDLIINSTVNNIGSKLYFIGGPGSSGKSYLHNVIIKYLMSLNMSFLAIRLN